MGVRNTGLIHIYWPAFIGPHLFNHRIRRKVAPFPIGHQHHVLEF